MKEHTWRTNRALNKVLLLSTSCLKACTSPLRLFDAGFVTKRWVSQVQCWFLPSLSPFHCRCHQAFLAYFDLLAGLLHGTLLSCPPTRFDCASMEIETHGSHSRKHMSSRYKFSVGFLLHPSDTAHTHTHRPHISFCSCSTPPAPHLSTDPG